MSIRLHAALVVAICAGVTIATRALPFICFGGRKGAPRMITALGRMLPSAIMAALVVYCMKNVPFGTLSDGLKQLIAAGVVAALHVWRRSTLLSIAGGTAVYMILIRI